MKLSSSWRATTLLVALLSQGMSHACAGSTSTAQETSSLPVSGPTAVATPWIVEANRFETLGIECKLSSRSYLTPSDDIFLFGILFASMFVPDLASEEIKKQDFEGLAKISKDQAAGIEENIRALLSDVSLSRLKPHETPDCNALAKQYEMFKRRLVEAGVVENVSSIMSLAEENRHRQEVMAAISRLSSTIMQMQK